MCKLSLLLSKSISTYKPQSYAVQYRSHLLYVVIEHLKCGLSKLRCVVSVKYTLGFKGLICKRECKLSH